MEPVVGTTLVKFEPSPANEPVKEPVIIELCESVTVIKLPIPLPWAVQ